MKTVLAYVITFTLATVVIATALAALLAAVVLALCFIFWSWNISIVDPWLLVRGLLALGALVATFFMCSPEGQDVIQGFKDGWDRA